MPKLAIYVPKKQMKLVERWRKRINFSQVFVKALMVEIEARSQPRHEYDAAAEYYATVPSADAAAGWGRQLGNAHVVDCKIAREDLAQLVRLAEEDELNAEHRRTVRKQIKRLEDADRVCEKLASFCTSKEEMARVEADFMAGYLRGVAAAWAEVKKRF